MEITELNKINLETGDVLVIKLKPRVGPFKTACSEDFEEQRTKMVQEIFPNNKVIFAEHGDTFEIIKQKALNEN